MSIDLDAYAIGFQHDKSHSYKCFMSDKQSEKSPVLRSRISRHVHVSKSFLVIVELKSPNQETSVVLVIVELQ
jgi:hypothetical protein